MYPYQGGGGGYPPQQPYGGYPPQQQQQPYGGYPPQQQQQQPPYGGYPPQQQQPGFGQPNMFAAAGFPPGQAPPPAAGYGAPPGGYPPQQQAYPPQQGYNPAMAGGFPPPAAAGFPPPVAAAPAPAPAAAYPPPNQMAGYQPAPPQQQGYPRPPPAAQRQYAQPPGQQPGYRPGFDPAASQATGSAQQMAAQYASKAKEEEAFYVDDVGYERNPNSPANHMNWPDLAVALQQEVTMRRYYTGGGKKPQQVKVKVREDGRNLYVCEYDSKSAPTIIYLRDVFEFRKGPKGLAFEKQGDATTAQGFSLEYNNQCLNLVALSDEDYDVWTHGLIRLIQELHKEDSEIAWASKQWYRLGSKNTIDVKETIDLMSLANLKVDASWVRKISQEVGANGTVIEFSTWQKILSKLRERPRAQELFRKYSGNGSSMTTDQFVKFLKLEQKQNDASPATAQMVLSALGVQGGCLTSAQFGQYIRSDQNDIFDISRRIVHMDMSRPITEYFINSSHNTYLEGNQLSGQSSVTMYIKVLKAGCRCIELDCWDGTGGPIITHGGTMCTKIHFHDVIEAISHYAFVSSPYPLILSIENHCSAPQQKQMAETMKQLFGRQLPPTLVGTNVDSLPSPDKLLYKILLKGPVADFSDPSAAKKDSQELSDMIYLKTASLKTPDEASKQPWEMSSFSELQYPKFNSADLCMYNVKQFSRIYPKGTRVDSSNYDPVNAWNRGCHMVALNYQTPSKSMWVNQGKFSDNGNCGYVIKPPPLRQTVTPFNPDNLPVGSDSSKIESMDIEIISARLLPHGIKIEKGTTSKNFTKGGGELHAIASPWIEVEVLGTGEDTSKRAKSTKRTPNNGLNPAWEEKFKFKFKMSELATLLFVAMDGKSKLGYYSIPVEAIRPGYRILPLKYPNGRLIEMCDILVHVDLHYKKT
eukprot:TRINITY_DN4494_c0_g3_i1.p1 TRINITY_DN4494_c0_g3~~TRINITY_DN4494_c0_g3_i1.p1  ORF type:complete len:923 (+),score=235.93 TRINITY_DN4494_c0_g3_i1:134-2902(+)